MLRELDGGDGKGSDHIYVVCMNVIHAMMGNGQFKRSRKWHWKCIKSMYQGSLK